jgi:Tfp pilus assembly protein PilP
MRRQAIVLLAGTLGLLAVGCGANDNAEVASSPSPEASPAATTQPFDAPLVSPKDGKDGKNAKVAASKTNKIAGLLESTDPEERAKQVQAGIRSRAGLDPFASLPATLQFSLPTGSNGSNGNIASNGLNSGGGRPRLGNLTAGGGGGGGQSPIIGLNNNPRGGPRGGGGSTVASINAIPSFPVVEPVRRPTQIARGPVGTNGLNAPGDKGLKPLPPLAEPKLAQAVEVTGVVTIGGITQAIIKAPNEPTGRHVEVGQRLSNGQVLVKRIEANAGSDPIVVFEENGQEVSRGVGEKSTPETGDTPTV